MNTTRRAALAVLAGLAVTGVIGASAASLGGLNVASLGSGDAPVEACNDDGVGVDFGVTLAGTVFVVDSVTVSDVDDACDGLSYEVVLFDDNDAELAREDGTVNLVDNAFDVTISAEPDAEDVFHVSLVISG